MKLFAISDIHTDVWFPNAVEKDRWKIDDPPESASRDTLEYIWNMYEYPLDVDAILVAGDIANDYLTTTYTLKWLSEKYKKVYFVVGNHELCVRGGTPSKSNLQFLNSYEKVTNLGRYADSLGNCYLLDASMRDGIAGTMGFADFKCCCYDVASEIRMKLAWRRSWFDGKHWRVHSMNPDDIWESERVRMHDLIGGKPKVLVTHYTPIQLGITFDARNDPGNAFFFFDAKEFLEEFEDDAYWVCGHTHYHYKAVYTNAKGAKVTILCNPNGYPESSHTALYAPSEKRPKTATAIGLTENEHFIIEI